MIGLEKQLLEKEEKLKEDYKSYDYIVKEKNQKIKLWENKFQQIELEVIQIAKEMEDVKAQNKGLKE